MHHLCLNCKETSRAFDIEGRPICLNCFENARWQSTAETIDLSKYGFAEALSVSSLIATINECGAEETFNKIDRLYRSPLTRGRVRNSFLCAVKELKIKFELFKIEE